MRRMYLVFDLDQTLIRGEDADWRAWLASIEEALGVAVPPGQDWATYPVHTDHGLFAEVSRRFRGRAHTPEERAVFERGYAARVTDVAALYEAIPGAAELLATLPRAALATGNLHAVTEIKLAASGLARFGLPCACSDDAPDRATLVATALGQLGWRPGDRAVSFGDGVWDVRAARALGIGFVGVAQSDAHEEKLREHGARVVIRDYVDREAVMRVIDDA
jgi:phosphoglycolate phosphatase-like HAD superfamily hydrolase